MQSQGQRQGQHPRQRQGQRQGQRQDHPVGLAWHRLCQWFGAVFGAVFGAEFGAGGNWLGNWRARCLGAALIGLIGWVLLGGWVGGTAAVPEAIASPTDPAPTAASASSASSAPNVPDASAIPAEKVERFATAYLQVLTLIGDRTEELHRAETEAAAAQLEREIEAQALDIIQAAGLSTADYLKLLGLANVDSEFRERIAAQVQERN